MALFGVANVSCGVEETAVVTATKTLNVFKLVGRCVKTSLKFSYF